MFPNRLNETPTGKSVEEEQRRKAFLSPSLDSKTRGVSANEGTLKLFQNHGSVIIGGVTSVYIVRVSLVYYRQLALNVLRQVPVWAAFRSRYDFGHAKCAITQNSKEVTLNELVEFSDCCPENDVSVLDRKAAERKRQQKARCRYFLLVTVVTREKKT